MQLRPADPPGAADPGDDLTTTNRLARADQGLADMRIGGHPAIGMTEEEQIAKAAKLVPDVDDDAVLGRPHRGAVFSSDIDAVVV